MKGKQRLNIKLNSSVKTEALMQEIYDEACRQIVSVQENMTNIIESTNLANETIENKAKYGKIINDFLTQKHNALGRKMEVAKLMVEFLKSKGNEDSNKKQELDYGSLDDVLNRLRDDSTNKLNETTDNEVYKIKRK